MAGEAVTGVEARLRRGALVRGCLDRATIDRAGGLEVELSGPTSYAAPVDVSGCFRIERVRPGAYEAEAARRFQVVAAGAFELPDGVSEIEIALEPVDGIEVRGRVVRHGLGVSGVTVELDHHVTVSTRTGADGGFVLHPVPVGEWEIEVRGAPGGRHRQFVEVRAGRELTLELVTGEISGQVRDAATGAGLSGVQLHLLAPGDPSGAGSRWQRKPTAKITTDALGAYVATGLAGGRYQLRVQHQGYSWVLTEVEVGTEAVRGVDFDLQPAQALVLQVTRADRGDAVAWAAVALFDPAGNLLMRSDWTAVDEGGRLRLDGIPAGRWEVWIQAQDSAWARLTVDHPGAEAVVVLRPGASVWFDIPAPVDDPQHLDYLLTAPDGRQLPPELSSPLIMPDGEVGTVLRGHIGHLWPERWTLELRHPDGRAWSAAFVAPPGKAQEVALHRLAGR